MPLLSDPQNQMTGLQWSALQRFFSSPLSAQFFLTGGTALAGFYFGHRKSVDLDFFTLQTFDHQKLKEHLESIAQAVDGVYAVKIDVDSLLTGIIKVGEESLKVDLVQDIPVHTGVLQTAGTIRVDALENIGSNKITAIYGRLAHKSLPGKSHSTARPSLSAANRSSLLEVDKATPSSRFTVFARNCRPFVTKGTSQTGSKDFVDLYWILEVDKKLDFEELLNDAKKKDLGIADFHLGMIFLNPPPANLFPATMPAVKPETIIGFFKKLGEKLVARAEKPQFLVECGNKPGGEGALPERRAAC